MAKEAVFTMKLERELRDAFMAAAKREDRPASQIVREFMRDYVRSDHDYLEFLRRKIEKSHEDIEAERVFPAAEVEAEMDQFLAELEQKSREAAA